MRAICLHCLFSDSLKHFHKRTFLILKKGIYSKYTNLKTKYFFLSQVCSSNVNNLNMSKIFIEKCSVILLTRVSLLFKISIDLFGLPHLRQKLRNKSVRVHLRVMLLTILSLFFWNLKPKNFCLGPRVWHWELHLCCWESGQSPN